LVGVYDIDRAQAKKIADRFDVKVFDSVDEMLGHVDVISVCTTTTNHFDCAMKAIKAGKSVLLEKPFTGDSVKASELCEVAEREGVTLAAGFLERFNPVVSVVREAVRAGTFGRVISLASRRVSSFPSRIRDVGAIMDLGIHDIDVLRYISSAEVEAVFALGGKIANPSFEDNANILMEMENGLIGSVEVNWLTPMKVRKVSLTCSSGFVQLDYIDQSVELSSSKIGELDSTNAFHVPLEYDVRRISVRKEEPLKRELIDFFKAAESHSEPFVGGWEAVADLKVCRAALDSLQQGKRITIS
jgi:UDP-N-acetylglucosamine 3-dehydrogenase